MISVVIISKDEASLDDTLTDVAGQAQALGESAEIVVVDASDGRLDDIRLRHQAEVRWVQFDQPPRVTVSIPHQRNVGVRTAEGEIIVFIDAGCRPEPEWLALLVKPLFQDEHIAAGEHWRQRGRPANGRRNSGEPLYKRVRQHHKSRLPP
jgi:glycosyltransferase involved in cell wall biosynthesis